jgi:hypothetical protein
MKQEVISGAKAAAKYLNVSRRTIHRLIQQGTFPKPIQEIPVGEERELTLKIWTKEDLDSFKPQIRTKGRPKIGLSK